MKTDPHACQCTCDKDPCTLPSEVAAAVLNVVTEAHGYEDARDDDVSQAQHAERRLACTATLCQHASSQMRGHRSMRNAHV